MSLVDSCSCCGDELASVTVKGPGGSVLVGRKCARLLEVILRLCGARDDEVRRGPALQRVK